MKKYIKMLGYVLLISLTYLVLNKFAAFIYFYKLGELLGVGESLSKNIPLFHLFQDVIQVPFYILFFKYLKKQSMISACNFSPINKNAVITLIVVGLSISLFTGSLTRIPWVQTGMPNVGALLNDRLLDQNIFQFAIWVTLHAGLYRELLFRGMLFNEFRSVLPIPIAISLQGLMYGFLFFGFSSPDLVFYSFLTCLIMGYVYVWCDSMWAPVIMQVVSFTGLYILKRVGDAILVGESVAYVIGVAMILITAGMMYLMEYAGKHHASQSQPVGDEEVKELPVA